MCTTVQSCWTSHFKTLFNLKLILFRIAVVKSGSMCTLSDPFTITCGVQQRSVLSPTFFLTGMDKLLRQLKETSSGTSTCICGPYLCRAGHADDVHAISFSATVAEVQSWIIHDFSSENGLKQNSDQKAEIVKSFTPTGPHSWDHTSSCAHCLSARLSVESNINKARWLFFVLGCFLGHSNPLSAREMMETCVIPTLLYGAEDWILDEGCLELLENLQAEIGRRILKLSRYYSSAAVRIGLSLPCITSSILKQKLSNESPAFLWRWIYCHLNIKTIIASQNAYNLPLVKQCIFLDYKLKTNCTAQILSMQAPLSELWRRPSSL